MLGQSVQRGRREVEGDHRIIAALRDVAAHMFAHRTGADEPNRDTRHFGSPLVAGRLVSPPRQCLPLAHSTG
jgi:hypothetical protein